MTLGRLTVLINGRTCIPDGNRHVADLAEFRAWFAARSPEADLRIRCRYHSDPNDGMAWAEAVRFDPATGQASEAFGRDDWDTHVAWLNEKADIERAWRRIVGRHRE